MASVSDQGRDYYHVEVLSRPGGNFIHALAEANLGRGGAVDALAGEGSMNRFSFQIGTYRNARRWHLIRTAGYVFFSRPVLHQPQDRLKRQGANWRFGAAGLA